MPEPANAHQNERLTELGRVTAHVAQQMCDQLVPVSLYMSLLRRRLSADSGSLDVLAKVEAGFASLEATVSDLVGFAGETAPRWERFDVRQLVEDVLDALSRQLEDQAIMPCVDVPFSTFVTADRNMIRRAILNLVLNALDAMPDGGQLTVTSYEGQGGLELEFADEGNGLDDEARRRAFEPFYTTKSGATGLGLAFVQRTAAAHGGDVSALNCPDGGAAFTLRIPRPAMKAAA